MLLVTPCTDWYLIFTGIAKGNVALSTAILPMNLILQIILLPFYLLIFGGTTGMTGLSFLVESVLVVLLPLLLAIAIRSLLKNRDWLSKNHLAILTTLARNSPIALAIAMTVFPDQPLIALTLVIGPLLELPVLAIITQLLLTLRKNSI